MIRVLELAQHRFVLMVGFGVLAVSVSFWVANTSPSLSLAVTVAIAVFVLAFSSTEAALYLLIFSMLLSPELGSRATEGGGATVRVDDFLLMVIGCSWLARMAIYKELGLFLKTRLNRPILYYIVACFLATAIGVMAGRVVATTGFLFVLKYIEYFVVYFMVSHYVKERKQIKNFLLAMFVTCLVVCLVAMWQIPSGGRVTAPFEGESGEPNTLGGYLVFLLSLAIAFVLHLKDNKQRLALIGVILMMLLSLMYTLSRSSWIALIPMYLTFLVLTPYQKPLLLGLFVLMLLLPLAVPTEVFERLDYTFQDQKIVHWQEEVAGVTLDTSTSARLHDWKRALGAFIDKPLFGHGITGWQFVDNQYVRTLVELGLVGMVAFLSLIYVILRETWKIYNSMRTPLSRGLSLGLLVGTVALLTHAIAGNTFIIVRIMEPFWFVVGMVMVLPNIEWEEASQNGQPEGQEVVHYA